MYLLGHVGLVAGEVSLFALPVYYTFLRMEFEVRVCFPVHRLDRQVTREGCRIVIVLDTDLTWIPMLFCPFPAPGPRASDINSKARFPSLQDGKILSFASLW